MARRKVKTAKRQRKRQGTRPSNSDVKNCKPLINVCQRLDTTLLCCNRYVPSEISCLIGGYYKDCLAHHVRDRIQVNYHELESKTRFTRHAQALLQEITEYMQTFKDNTSIMIAPTIHLLSSLFFANPGIKSDVFMHTFDAVFKAVTRNGDELGFNLLEYLFAVFDSYVRNDQSTSSTIPVTWNTRCVEHLLDAGAADLVLQAAADLVESPADGTGAYTKEDSLRIGWVVAKVFCIYLQDNPSSRHIESLSRFNDASGSIGNKIEELSDT